MTTLPNGAFARFKRSTSTPVACRLPAMANSRFQYVKEFERDQKMLPNSWMVVRIDGRCFSSFTKDHGFRLQSTGIVRACSP